MLIEKEWVALGHPFRDRLGLVTQPDDEEKQVIVLEYGGSWLDRDAKCQIFNLIFLARAEELSLNLKLDVY